MKKINPLEICKQIEAELKHFELDYTVRVNRQCENEYDYVISKSGFDMIVIKDSFGKWNVGICLIDWDNTCNDCDDDESESVAWLGEFTMFTLEISDLLKMANNFINKSIEERPNTYRCQ